MIRFDGSEAHRRLEIFLENCPPRTYFHLLLLLLSFCFLFVNFVIRTILNPSPIHLDIYIYISPFYFYVTLSSFLLSYRHSTLTPLHFYPNPSPSFQFRPRKIFFFLHFNFHFFSSILPFLPLPSTFHLPLLSSHNFFYFLDLSILVTRSTHSPSSVPPSFVHRSFPLSSPDTPSASSLPVLPPSPTCRPSARVRYQSPPPPPLHLVPPHSSNAISSNVLVSPDR